MADIVEPVRPLFKDEIYDEYEGDSKPQFDITNPLLPLYNAILQKGTRITAGQMNNLIVPENIISFGGTVTDYDYSDKRHIWLKIYTADTTNRLIFEAYRDEIKAGNWEYRDVLHDIVIDDTGASQDTQVQERRLQIVKSGKSLQIGVLGSSADDIVLDETNISGGSIGTWVS